MPTGQMCSVCHGTLSHIAKKCGFPRNVERQQKAALQSYANRAYQVTHSVHIFKSHYLYFTKQTVSCGIAPKTHRVLH